MSKGYRTAVAKLSIITVACFSFIAHLYAAEVGSIDGEFSVSVVA